MGTLRDHESIAIDSFNGLWRRGDANNTPLDHFQDCENIRFFGSSSFGSRFGITPTQAAASPLSNVKRIYNYPTQTGNTILVLVFDVPSNTGKIYHVTSPTVANLILSIVGMTDFAFIPYGGHAYISPFTSYTVTALDGTTLNQEKGLSGEFLYVYKGDGSPARKAAGTAPGGLLTVNNGAAGHTDAGLHLFGVVFETDTGYLTSIGAIQSFTTAATFSVSFTNVPTGGSSVVKRHIVATQKLTAAWNGDPFGAQYFFIPNATINDNTTTSLSNISFYDADLIDDASHLIDNYSQIPAGAVLSTYRDRLVLAATFTDISLAIVSATGEPEAISQIDGLIIVPLDGNPITNVQELRDVMYVTKRSRTVSYADNGDVPSSWPLVVVDNSLGSCVHGIATVLDSGSSTVDYLLVATYQGISIFRGIYTTPELSWKIEDYWKNLDRNEFRKIQIVHSPIRKEIYIVLPTKELLVGNYQNGMDPKNIRWSPWSIRMGFNTVAIVNIDDVVFGCDLT